jgi:hypothetical protein
MKSRLLLPFIFLAGPDSIEARTRLAQIFSSPAIEIHGEAGGVSLIQQIK